MVVRRVGSSEERSWAASLAGRIMLTIPDRWVSRHRSWVRRRRPAGWLQRRHVPRRDWSSWVRGMVMGVIYEITQTPESECPLVLLVYAGQLSRFHITVVQQFGHHLQAQFRLVAFHFE